MKKTILVITPRLPDMASRSGRRLCGILRALVRSHEVHLTYLQTMFTAPDALQPFAELGVQMVPGDVFKRKLYSQSAETPPPGQYAMVLFTGILIAKYYIPKMNVLAPGALVVIDTAGSSFLAQMQSAQAAADPLARKVARKAALIVKPREIPLCSNADMLLAENPAGAQILAEVLPSVPVRTVPSYAGQPDDEQQMASAVSEAFGAVAPAVLRYPPLELLLAGDGGQVIEGEGLFSETRVIDSREGETTVGRYNRALRSLNAEWGLLVPAGAIIDANSVRRMLFAAHHYAHAALIAPASNRALRLFTKAQDLPAFRNKHYFGNFGNWHEVRETVEHCFLIRKAAVDQLGLLDTRFRTLEGALTDLCLRIFQQGGAAVVDFEAFVHYDDIAAGAEPWENLDRPTLLGKWGAAGTRAVDRIPCVKECGLD